MATSKMQRRKPGKHPVSWGTDKIVTKSGALGCKPDKHASYHPMIVVSNLLRSVMQYMIGSSRFGLLSPWCSGLRTRREARGITRGNFRRQIDHQYSVAAVGCHLRSRPKAFCAWNWAGFVT